MKQRRAGQAALGVAAALTAAAAIGFMAAPQPTLALGPVNAAGSALPPVPQALPSSPQTVVDMRRDITRAVLGTRIVFGSRSLVSETSSPLLGLPTDLAAETASAQTMDIPLRFGLISHALVLNPSRPGECSALVHGGHGSVLLGDGDRAILTLLKRGCTTVLIDMPLHGRNAGQKATLPDGRIVDLLTPKFTDSSPTPVQHDQLRSLDSVDATALDLFISPVVTAVDFLEFAHPHVPVTAVGLSGGGWTVETAAAIDTRITNTISVAGSAPIDNLETCVGDYEQCHPALYSKVSYQAIYALAAIGKDRRFVKVLNLFDACCYSGLNGLTFVTPVNDAVASARQGGAFFFYADAAPGVHGYTESFFKTLEWLIPEPKK